MGIHISTNPDACRALTRYRDGSDDCAQIRGLVDFVNALDDEGLERLADPICAQIWVASDGLKPVSAFSISGSVNTPQPEDAELR